MILSSNCSFAKSFKKDVSKILVDLRKQGCLSIKDDKLTLTLPVRSAPTKIKKDDPYIGELVNSELCIGSTMDEHVLYMALMDLDNVYAVAKIGYTRTFTGRSYSLKGEYRKRPIFIRLAVIKSQSNEENLHDLIRKSGTELPFEMKIDGKDKTELYYLTKSLVRLFDDYVSTFNNSTLMLEHTIKLKEIESRSICAVELTKQIEAQEITKRTEIQEHTKQIEAQETTKQEHEKTRQAEIALEMKKLELTKVDPYVTAFLEGDYVITGVSTNQF